MWKRIWFIWGEINFFPIAELRKRTPEEQNREGKSASLFLLASLLLRKWSSVIRLANSKCIPISWEVYLYLSPVVTSRLRASLVCNQIMQEVLWKCSDLLCRQVHGTAIIPNLFSSTAAAPGYTHKKSRLQLAGGIGWLHFTALISSPHFAHNHHHHNCSFAISEGMPKVKLEPDPVSLWKQPLQRSLSKPLG